MKLYKYFLMALILFAAAGAQAQVAVIANKSVPDGSLSINKVTDIFSLRQKTWSNGSAIVPIVLSTDGSTSSTFYSAIGTSSIEIKKLWMRLQLTGEAQAPQAVGSQDELVSKVASTPGAIGFVDAAKANGSVKTLLIVK